MGNASSRYWKIWRIHPSGERLGYKQIPIPVAQEFIKNQVWDSQISNQEKFFLSCFYAQNNPTDYLQRAQAGLCLRCYVSEPILKQCKKIDYLFSGEKQFSYRDLLPFVLNDDGQKLIILDPDKKIQLMVDEKNQIKESRYKYFSVTVLQTFNSELRSRMSLDNWAYLQTKQNPELKKFLAEFGFKHLSDWALLNRVRTNQLERLLLSERHLVQAFHAVYRRDRQMLNQKKAKKCPDPTNEQLQEMLVLLRESQVVINTPSLLVQELKNIAQQLRSFDVWNSREPLDIYDPESGGYQLRRDMPTESLDEEDGEELEFLQFLRQCFDRVLGETIQQEVEANINRLSKSSKYAPFADKYLQGLQLYYCQGMSLKEIAPELGMSSWDQARRILNPGELLTKVRASAVEKMLASILEKAAAKGLTTIPPQLDYLTTLTAQIEVYVDGEVFQAAAEEIRAGKNRKMSSVFAQKLRSLFGWS